MPMLLLVEHNEMSRTTLSRRLRHKGFHVLVAADASSCMALLAQACPDVILMDMRLPDRAGCWRKSKPC